MPAELDKYRMIRVFPLQLQFLNDALDGIFKRGQNAYEVVNQKIRSDKRMGSRDRRQFTARVYHLVRWWNLIQYVANWSSDEKKAEARFNELIFVSFWMEGLIPDSKNLELYKNNVGDYNERLNLAPNQIRRALPTWIDDLGKEQYGSEWFAVANSLNDPAPMVIRVNSLKTNSDKLLNQLNADNIEALKIGTNAISISNGKNLRNHKLFKKGFFEFQDYHSQLVGEFINVRQNQTVIDFCAGAGGKSIHLSSLMNNSGKIYASDQSLERMQDLPKRIKRSGSRNIQIIEKAELLSLDQIADVVLLDLPCSGLGTLKRKPDIKWKLTKEKLVELIELQRTIIQEAIPLVKHSGSLVIVTCSILKNESEDQVQWILSKFPEFKLGAEQRLHPHTGGYDGFYMAKISFHS